MTRANAIPMMPWSTIRYYDGLLRHLVLREFKLRYAGSVLGVLWSLLVPLAHLGALVFTFGSVVPVDINDYPAFVYTALLPWTWFSSALSSAGFIFFSHRDLVRRPNFPPGILVVVNTLSHFLTLVLSLPFLALFLAWYGRGLSISALALPILFVVQGLMIIGLSLLIATWNVFYRDIAQLVSVILSLLFFLTPIFYRPLLDSQYSWIFDLNPLANLIICYRSILFDGRMPAITTLLQSCVTGIVLLTIGYLVYRSLISEVVDAV